MPTNQTHNPEDNIHPATLRMAQFIASIVKTGTISSSPARQTAVPCRRAIGRNKCTGFIKVQRQDIPTQKVNWCCNKCDESGTVSGIKESYNNLTEFADDTASADTHPIILTRQEYKALLDSDLFEPTCERIILEAIPLTGGIQLNMPADDLEYFMETIAPVCNHEKNKSRAKLLDNVFGKCLDLSDALIKREER